jgi:tetratricopeptide (TPR) repeat protein
LGGVVFGALSVHLFMRRLLLSLAVLCLLAPPARAAREDDAAGHVLPSAVKKLIAELGSDEYAVRRRAEEQLIRLGPEAFDELKAAEDSDDLEIADRVRYIVQRMRVQWIHPEDAPDVRRLLTRYGDLSEDNRGERITKLAALPDGGGLAALCRIARYDASPMAARRAALAMLKRELPAETRQQASTACLKELGSSTRPPVVWMQLYLRELDDPRATIAEWAAATAAEAELLTEKSPDTDFVTTYDLLERHLGKCNDLKLGDETTAALVAIVDLTIDEEQPDQLSAGLAWALRWVIKNQRWDVLAQVEDRYDEQFRASRKLLYYLAAAADKAGRKERSETLAKKAFELAADDDDRRVEIAESVAALGYVDWAEREYRRAIESYPVIDKRSMEARTALAIWLHDREDFQAAADLLGEFFGALDADAAGRRRLVTEINEGNGSGREELASTKARWQFYLACVDGARQDYDGQRKRLKEAADEWDKDPDILIAMYRVPGSDEAFQRDVRSRIKRASHFMQALIDEYPQYPGYFNQWAWLIANTEGDQQQAVEYSKKSLELAPEEPSYLDTLGRCYYAVGDLENAVKSQRRAVELSPHYRVMQRQLAMFEAALAEKSAK